MPITGEADLYAALSNLLNTQWAASSVTSGIGQLVTLYRQLILPTPTAATPTASGAALDRTSPGALTIFGSGAGKTNYVAGMTWGQASTVNTHIGILYDRLVETGALDATLTTAQTVNSVALPSRASTGDQVEMWVEVYVQTGATGATATISYTNQAGTAGQTATCVLPAVVRVATCWPVSLAPGDTGVRSVQSVTLSANTGSGTIGITLRKQIGPMIHDGLAAPYGAKVGWAETSLAAIPTDACVEMCMLAGATTANTVFGSMQTIQA